MAKEVWLGARLEERGAMVHLYRVGSQDQGRRGRGKHFLPYLHPL